MNPETWVPRIFLLSLAAIVITAVLKPPQKPRCVEEVRVVEILELRYRDAVILTSDGQHRTVNQATLRPGDALCVRRDK
jgi:hypothetical protein